MFPWKSQEYYQRNIKLGYSTPKKNIYNEDNTIRRRQFSPGLCRLDDGEGQRDNREAPPRQRPGTPPRTAMPLLRMRAGHEGGRGHQQDRADREHRGCHQPLRGPCCLPAAGRGRRCTVCREQHHRGRHRLRPCLQVPGRTGTELSRQAHPTALPPLETFPG